MSITHRTAKLCPVVLAFLAAFAGSIAQGYTIGFDSLGGLNDDPFAGHSEGGFTVSPISGNWRIGQNFGAPIPSIFGRPPNAGTVRVTDTVSGLFSFGGVNLAGITNPTATYTVEGFRNNSSVLITFGTLSISDVFFNISSPNPSTVLDRLDITISPTSATSFNVDNIVVDRVVPEPSTLALITMWSLVGFVTRRSRRPEN